uniref:Ferrochelatase n=1 Tax=Setaria italica TaxID=4555 RepID=A0A0Q3RKF5_SETIT
MVGSDPGLVEEQRWCISASLNDLKGTVRNNRLQSPSRKRCKGSSASSGGNSRYRRDRIVKPRRDNFSTPVTPRSQALRGGVQRSTPCPAFSRSLTRGPTEWWAPGSATALQLGARVKRAAWVAKPSKNAGTNRCGLVFSRLLVFLPFPPPSVLHLRRASRHASRNPPTAPRPPAFSLSRHLPPLPLPLLWAAPPLSRAVPDEVRFRPAASCSSESRARPPTPFPLANCDVGLLLYTGKFYCYEQGRRERMWSSSQASTRGVVEMGRVEAGPSHFPKRPAPRNPTRVNLSRTHAVKPCSAGDRAGISVKCNLGWSSQPSPDLKHHFIVHSSASEAVLTSQSDMRKLFVGNEKIGVLLLNLGGPETLDDVQPFLFNLFADPDIIRLPRLFRFLQKPLAKFISVVRAPKSKEGYASIGGGSPLRQITDAQAEALREALCEKDVPAKVYVGMRYWHPFTEEAIEQIKRDGITKLVVLPLYPQFSISTSGSSLRLLESIFREDEYLVNMQHTVIPSWYQREGYIKAMATLIENELTKFSEPQKVMIFFSAHGVPLAYVEEAGDPYKAEMEECIDLIMEDLEKKRNNES